MIAREIPALVDNSLLRILTVFLFYFCQGVPIGLFYYAVPAWMANGGASSAQIASVVGIASLPWTLKLVNGFIMDRYTFLPMGRRRIWVIGAQSTMAGALLVGAALSPLPAAVTVIAALAFVVNMATTFQDVAIDGLVVDIMTEEEQSKAAGVMFGAQVLGISASTAVNGWIASAHGIATAFGVSALLLIAVMTYVVVLRERHGERRFPWSKGEAHRRNLEIQIDAWWPLLKRSFKAVFTPASLLFIPFLLLRATPWGAGEAYQPVLATEIAGWEATDYTGVNSSSMMVSALFGLVICGWLISKMGPRRSLAISLPVICVIIAAMAAARAAWSDPMTLAVYIFALDLAGMFFSIAAIPLAMRLCSPAVAATQFTIYMALANFGRPLGAWIAGLTTGGAHPETMYWALAAIFAVAAVCFPFLRFPGDDPAVEAKLAHGAGVTPVES